jgi:hypothetical protein
MSSDTSRLLFVLTRVLHDAWFGGSAWELRKLSNFNHRLFCETWSVLSGRSCNGYRQQARSAEVQALPPAFHFTLNIIKQHTQLYGSKMRHKLKVLVDASFDVLLAAPFFDNIQGIVTSPQAALQLSITTA